MTAEISTQTKIDLSSVLKDVFMVLNEKEQQIITQRFALDGRDRCTLEEIGQAFSVTRERIRQIEKIALNKLHRTATNTRLQEINNLARQFLQEAGGILSEDKIISEILNSVGSSKKIDGYIIRLSLHIDKNITPVKHSNLLRDGWMLKDTDMKLVEEVIDYGISLLEKKKDILPEARLVNDTLTYFVRKGKQITPNFVINSLGLNIGVKRLENGWGLTTWRHINPRSIRDKALIIFRQEKRPMHFVELANKITEADFNKKIVTVQAVHNELIRYDEFVLVGRGLYALREWGYTDGTVADVIERVLSKSKDPMTKQKIIEEVMRVRNVRVGTISLNLQKNGHFVRVGRAVYALDLTKKPKAAR